MQEAMYYQKTDDGSVECQLCPQNCKIAEGKMGRCRVRKVIDGKLYATSYGSVTALNIDPIEKKPLFHFHPGSKILSLGTVGCNLSCSFCQNHSISQNDNVKLKQLSPKEAVELALKNNSIGIAYTYSEPLVWYEYILATAELARKNGLKNVLVTNGMINRKPFKELVGYLDAINIDLKSFSDQFYQQLCGGRVEPVKEIIDYVATKTHLEITTLLIPGYNDDRQLLKDLTEWIAKIDHKIPLHLSRYFPRHKLKEQITSLETLLLAKEIAKQRLDYVYLGNISEPSYRNTHCPNCNNLIVERSKKELELNLKAGKCPKCAQQINIITD